MLETEGSPTVSAGCGVVGRASSTLPPPTLFIALAESSSPPKRVGGGVGLTNLSCLTFRNGECRVLQSSASDGSDRSDRLEHLELLA